MLAAWLLQGTARFLPAYASKPGWLAFVDASVAFSPHFLDLFGTWYQQLLSAASVATNVVFIMVHLGLYCADLGPVANGRVGGCRSVCGQCTLVCSFDRGSRARNWVFLLVVVVSPAGGRLVRPCRAEPSFRLHAKLSRTAPMTFLLEARCFPKLKTNQGQNRHCDNIEGYSERMVIIEPDVQDN